MLRQGDELTLALALTHVRSTESAGKEATNLRDNTSTTIQQMRKSTYKKEKTNKAFDRPDTSQQHAKQSVYQTGGCYGCGGPKRCEKGKCRAFGKICRGCEQPNHFEKVCRAKKKVQGITAWKAQISAITASDRVTIRIFPQQRGQASWTMSALPDTGAEIDAIPEALFNKNLSGIRLRQGIQPVTAVGTPITSKGTFVANLEWAPKGVAKRTVSSIVHVPQGLNQPVLSKATQIKLGMLPADYPHVQIQRLGAPAATSSHGPRIAHEHLQVQLKETILNGFPNDKCNLPECLRPYWNIRERLAIDERDGMTVLGARIVVPKSIRQDIIRDLLRMHQGATKLRQRARLSLYWPGMDNEIANAAQTCDECVKRLPSHAAETLRTHDPATRPFEQIHADLGEVNGRNFLIMVDQFSGWPHVVPFTNTNTSARQVIDAARQFFSNVGAPVRFWSDNGPQFKAAEFKQFLKDWGIVPGTSSPHYAQSNGRAEAEVKTMKKLIIGSSSSGTFDPDKFAKALLLFRNAPRLGGASPSQLVFNRPVRDSLPVHHRAFAAEWQAAADVLEERAKRSKDLQVENYNRKAHDLAELEIGNHVLIQPPLTKQWDTHGIIIELGPNRDYSIKTAVSTAATAVFCAAASW